MSQPDDFNQNLGQDLHRRRPAPSRRYQMRLREHLLAADASARRPKRLWLLVAVYLASGTVLLVLALLGTVGSGPFGS
jgi:hypothetical protein